MTAALRLDLTGQHLGDAVTYAITRAGVPLGWVIHQLPDPDTGARAWVVVSAGGGDVDTFATRRAAFDLAAHRFATGLPAPGGVDA